MAFKSSKITRFLQCSCQALLEFSQVPKAGVMTVLPYTLSRSFVPGSKFVTIWNGKAACQQRKNGVGLASRILSTLIHSRKSENMLFLAT